MYKIVLSFLLISVIACKQQSSVADKINSNIQNSKTNKHVHIPGTRLYIVPPANFTVSQTPAGLRNGDLAGITVTDLVNGNYYTNAASFNKAGFVQRGIKTYDFQEIKVNGYPAKYVSLQGDEKARMYWLVFGDSSFSTMVMGVYPAGDLTSGKAILGALNTIYYDKNEKIDPFAAAAFSLDDSQSKFKFFQFSTNMYVYTVGGKDNKNEPDAPFLVLTQMPIEKGMKAKNVGDMMLSKLEGYGLTHTEIKNASAEKINGYDAYEAEVHGQMHNKPSIMYQCVIANGDNVISMQGIAKDNFDENIAAFKALAHTIKIK
ncbi:hypothetical protein A4H97_09255 [Niastella yeongjuensis]|uniref:Uncharacterized protein n=1 Tax=Niastella yeongjuensis TaxID=354355 RepID=A0A1V9EEI3_9BACT|nr:hypothetical protein [Niastella yeongjuensis]OQP44548.1 hypothetical protein A4H97_09255 [Niastella yeongjuensis]SEO83871.1 hypothetical protein SAMN05660816_03695 [Niastella yeongjuensis]